MFKNWYRVVYNPNSEAFELEEMKWWGLFYRPTKFFTKQQGPAFTVLKICNELGRIPERF